ncbi:MAG: hypothetical protein EVJ46_00220 [Candidatus Acididesulfobacter guangdongensis]|uniref:Uncharacterized protein n=1 Tax=Acididesulfobacter guangdongensis TaxID=2597225 RepID=A0A519BHH5_ACIG2|nr:MAG: hypothetical protein EVJ46_00220 [Candidatus Acididesulfobacter guangdongensis]
MNDITHNLSLFAGIVEANLEYTLRLLTVLEEPAAKYKDENCLGKLKKLKTEIENGMVGNPSEEIIRITTFIAIMESIYNSTNEIKINIKELVGYPPVDLELLEITVNMSGIVKKSN